MNGDIRTKQLKTNALSMLVVKGISMAVSLLYVPLLLNTLNSTKYGLWLTLTSIVSWCSMLDIGFGHGLRNKLSEAVAKQDYELGKKYVSTAYASVFLLISVFILLFLLVSNSFLPWNRILNVNDILPQELNLLVNIVFVSFGAQFVLGLINSILYALQMPAYSSYISMIGQLLSFVFVYVAIAWGGVVDLVSLAIIISITPVVVLFCSSIFLFRGKYRNIAPSLTNVHFCYVRDILSLGVKFFVLQITAIVIYQTNNLIITNVLGPDYVTEYNIAYKYMYIIYTIYAIMVTPIWSATTDAYYQGDITWIRETIRQIRRLFFVGFVCSLIAIVVAPIFYKLWIGEKSLLVHYSTTIFMALFVVSQMLYGIYGYIVNGIGKIRLIVIINIILAVCYVPVAIGGAKVMGIAGVCLATAIVNIILYVVSKIQTNKLLNGVAVGVWNK